MTIVYQYDIIICMKRIILSLTEKQDDLFTQFAKDEGISKSELFRRILKEWLDRQAKNNESS